MSGRSPLRDLPGVDELLRQARSAGLEELMERAGHQAAVGAARDVIAAERRARLDGGQARGSNALLAALETAMRSQLRPPLRRVINATGVILQTNLGRAPLSEAAISEMEQVSGGYSNLEFDLEDGRRGSRHEHIRRLLRATTGAADAIVVNNNAAALFMVLSVFAAGREVVVSRGQAVEIGGGFRIPDVLRQSAARLVEVGTTNRTYATDYEEAISDETAALLRVHSSNFRVVGFTAAPGLEELKQVAARHGVLLLDDLGSGCLLPTERWGMAHEPTVQESLTAGANLVLFSGDKLLGGPQAGIIVGDEALVARLRAHPLARALRVDKTTIAGLAATLSAYERGQAEAEIPVWRMLSLPQEELRRRAESYVGGAGCGEVVESRSMVGGGSLPEEGIAGPVAAIPSPGPDRAAAAMRACDPPVVARIEDGRLVLDPRTVDPKDDKEVIAAVRQAIQNADSIDLHN